MRYNMKKFFSTILAFVAVIAIISLAVGCLIQNHNEIETEINTGIEIDGYWSDKNQAYYGLKVSSGILTLNDEEFYGVGLNFYNLFYDNFQSYRDTGVFNLNRSFEGLRVMAKNKIPVVRFNIMGYDRYLHGDTSLRGGDTSLYVNHKQDYLMALKALADEAERLHIGLLPSFFWCVSDIQDYYDEPLNYIGNPNSQTVLHIKRFTKDVINTLKNNKSVWGFEFGNEMNHAADLPNWVDLTPPLPPWSMRASRTIDDKITTDAVNYIYRVFAETVKENDPHKRMVSSGNGEIRASQYNNWKNGLWTVDTIDQYKEVSSYLNPRPMDTAGEHFYDISTFAEHVQKLIDYSKVNNQAVFIGEFGAVIPTGSKPPVENFIAWNRYFRIIVSKKVQLSFVWNYTLVGTTIVDSFNENTEYGRTILQMIQAANSKFAEYYNRTTP